MQAWSHSVFTVRVRPAHEAPADDRPWARPVLVVGQGLIGVPVRALLQAGGWPVACVSRDPARLAGCRAHDLASATGRAGLRAAIQEMRPRLIVLTHGPGGVEWTESHEREATAVHCGAAEVVAGSGVPALMVSTDHVFPGAHGGYRPSDPVGPVNAYGRVKLRAEELIMAASGLVLRLSLVYGWPGPGRPNTFAGQCLLAAEQGQPMLAQTDQVFTPVHVSDVAAVIAAICALPRPLSGIRHLAGPRELSRHDFAALAYRLADAEPSLVRPVRREHTQWASRPPFSCLECSDFADVPGLSGWRALAPEAGLSMMVAAAGEGRPRHAEPG
jgi:dTDP-4-dehydrorhamnose reductase